MTLAESRASATVPEEILEPLREVRLAPEPDKPTIVTVPAVVLTVNSGVAPASRILNAVAELAEFWNVAAPMFENDATVWLLASMLTPKLSTAPTATLVPKALPPWLRSPVPPQLPELSQMLKPFCVPTLDSVTPLKVGVELLEIFCGNDRVITPGAVTTLTWLAVPLSVSAPCWEFRLSTPISLMIVLPPPPCKLTRAASAANCSAVAKLQLLLLRHNVPLLLGSW